MATRQQKTPPTLHPVHDDIRPGGSANKEPEPEPVAAPQEPQGITGVGERGVESRVPFVVDSAGRKFVGAGHPDCGKPF